MKRLASLEIADIARGVRGPDGSTGPDVMLNKLVLNTLLQLRIGLRQIDWLVVEAEDVRAVADTILFPLDRVVDGGLDAVCGRPGELVLHVRLCEGGGAAILEVAEDAASV
ncbi:MAG: hypothetical protein GY913_23360 [Proteobacteria bacterium]|nr:hypothetical protein [Pseudomonadota bacterium]MCP4919851.1 hypothetical protein [Pseudomonadota bacterium]